MIKYKLKTPVEVEATQFTKISDFNLMLLDWGESFQAQFDISVTMKTLKFYSTKGLVTVDVSGWVTCDSNGVFGSMTDTVFNQTYIKA